MEPRNSSVTLTRWLAPTCELLWWRRWQKVTCPSPAVDQNDKKQNQLRVSQRFNHTYTHPRYNLEEMYCVSNLEEPRANRGSVKTGVFPRCHFWFMACISNATVHIVHVSTLAHTHTHTSRISFMSTSVSFCLDLFFISPPFSTSYSSHFGEHRKPVCQDSSVTVSVFTELLGVAGGKGKWLCAPEE